MKKIFTLLLSILMLALTIVPMAGAVGVAGQETPEYEITVVGADNIAALQKAGVLRTKESQSVIAEEPEDGPLYEITVSGAENIAAYKAAGIIRECATTRAGMPRDVEMAARAPSKVWNLYDQGCRATSIA